MTQPWTIGIVGLGYVGLPLAQLFLEQGHTVYGIDTDQTKLSRLEQGTSYLADFSDQVIKELFQNGTFAVSSSYALLENVDAIILCVPTPLDTSGEPDLQYVRKALQSTLPHLQKGQLLVLESSTYPGTTEEEIAPQVKEKGWNIGQDIHVAYSPERINPGQSTYKLASIPKVVGGETPSCTKRAKGVYASVFDEVVEVSSSKVAEVSKLVENAQRLINISFMNEVAMLCDSLHVNIWEVIDACSTKPFGFTPYTPGPGVGGHCIPVDPLYLNWKANQQGMDLSLIQAAKSVNARMPRFVIEKVKAHLGVPLEQSNLLMLGVTYKKNVNDIRESPALQIFEHLLDVGANVSYHDPYVPSLTIDSSDYESRTITKEMLENQHGVLILTDHSCLPYQMILDHSALIVDTRNVLKGYENKNNVVLL
ncbi:nucleotide sugar dehydrogenase [Salimicrobium halophilum]|uniref:UDP-N-acetyl-D-glucosamine dehydrogenase n=1 Tax=Salimicrobium halophilum TaxID=86666 RepID=A0A1G8UK71_9BACI|nr:nucleotide sugar dehydrogenase [Salimicrobium halophilum]SDJ53370.1 UDP-N-acetyl-D-glucosamine dehydrogenase [Salimicrobium halophilum]